MILTVTRQRRRGRAGTPLCARRRDRRSTTPPGFTLSDLRARANRQQLTADFQAFLDGFSPNVQDILDNFEFRNQVPHLAPADAVGTLIETPTSPDINLSPGL